MKALQAYVDQKNAWSKMFGGRVLDLKSAADRKRIAESIDCELSPENLSCDGELPASQVRARHRRLIQVAQELNRLDPVAAQSIYELSF